jgi:hypothetical protein
MDPTILIACSPPHSAQTAAVPGPGPPVMAASGHHGTRRGVAHVGMPWTAALNWARVPRAGEEPRGNGLSRARGWDGWISTAPPPLWHLDQGRGVVGLVMGTSLRCFRARVVPTSQSTPLVRGAPLFGCRVVGIPVRRKTTKDGVSTSFVRSTCCVAVARERSRPLGTIGLPTKALLEYYKH